MEPSAAGPAEPTNVAFYLEPHVKWCGAGPAPADVASARDVVFSATASDHVGVTVERAGFVVIDFGALEATRERQRGTDTFANAVDPKYLRLQLANCFCFFLREAYLSLQQIFIDPQRVLPESRVLVANGRRLYAPPSLEFVDEVGRLSPVGVHEIESDTFVGATHRLSALLADLNLVDVVDMVSEARWALQLHSEPTATALGWSASEALLRRMFRRTVGRKVPRKASAVVNALQSNGLLDAELADSLGEVREARNAWLHGLMRPSNFIAIKATLSARTLLADALGYPRPGKWEISHGL